MPCYMISEAVRWKRTIVEKVQRKLRTLRLGVKPEATATSVFALSVPPLNSLPRSPSSGKGQSTRIRIGSIELCNLRLSAYSHRRGVGLALGGPRQFLRRAD